MCKFAHLPEQVRAVPAAAHQQSPLHAHNSSARSCYSNSTSSGSQLQHGLEEGKVNEPDHAADQ